MSYVSVNTLKIVGVFFACFFIVILCLTPFYWLVIDHPYASYTDFSKHIVFAKDITFHGKWYIAPAFHIALSMTTKILQVSFESAAVLLGVLCTLTSAGILFVIFRRFVPFFSRLKSGLATAGLMLVSAAAIPSVSTYYLGQGSPNTWHSPTMLMLKPLILLFVASFVVAMQKEKFTRTTLLYLGSLLALSVLIKPNFALTAIPALGIFLLVKKTNLLLMWEVVVMVLPTVVLLIVQFFLLRLPISAGSIVEPSHTFLTWFGAWKVYSSNIPLSILLGLAFPLLLTLCRFREFKKNIALQFSWILVFVGLLQFAFLAESGVRFYDLNWSWGYNAALVPLFLFCAIELFQWIHSVQQKPLQLRQRLALAFIIILASWHVLSGALYFIHILMRGDPIV